MSNPFTYAGTMCGRYVTPRTEGLADLFRIDEVGEGLGAPTFNARPSFGEKPEDQEPPVPVVIESVRDGERRRRLWPARWPLTPRWSKSLAVSYPTFNAVSEDVTAKAAWRDAIKTHRAIFPAVGYYETQGSGKTRKRFYFHPDGGETLALGGLYSWWRAGPDAPWVLTAAILTIPAPGDVAAIHPRAPLILPDDHWDAWLNPDIKADQGFVDAAGLAAASLVGGLAFREVAWLDEDSSRMIEPIA